MPTRSRENDLSDAPGGLITHFAAQTPHPDDDDDGIDVWDDSWNHHDRDECPRCHNEQADDHGPQDCPYGGCDPGEHCPWECPYESGHTDWDRVYPHLGPAMHRGMALRIPGLDRHAAPHEIAQHILGEFHHNVGTHWTDHHDQARHYAHVMARDGDNLHAVLHAKRPERDDIETDPHELLRGDAIGYGNHSDREIPIQENAHVHLTGVSWNHPGSHDWHRHDFDTPIQHFAGAAERARFAPHPGEHATWPPARDRITHGLSTGELHIDDAEQIGYHADSRQHPDPTDLTRGWQTLPRQLWHTTTDLTGAREGLKTREELGMRHGTGLGGGPDNMISLTDSREHAHRMLHALHDYHAVLTGKTPLTELDRRARAGEGANRPYADHTDGLWLPHELSSVMRGQRHIQNFQAIDDARAAGLHPHPQTHTNLGTGLDGREYGVGWERPATPEELSHDRSEYYLSHMNARHHRGGAERPVLFMANHPHALAQRDPADFAVLHVTPHPGAQGWRVPGEHEWRTGTGDALHVQGVDPSPGMPHAAAKAWLPHDRFFGPGKPGLDPRLFDGDHLKPAWRKALYALAARALDRYGPEWHSWARVYLAGSQASHWYGNNDLDVLIGIEYDLFRSMKPARAAMTDGEIDQMLNSSAHEVCDPARYFDIDGKHLGPFDSTVYVNAGSYDIRRIKPYAAYDLTDDRWSVKPVEVPDDFGPDKLPGVDFKYARSLADQVKALKKLPAGQAGSLGAALYDHLHAARHDAFTDAGEGLYDPRNIAWKYLDQHPDRPMEQLVAWKRAAEQSGAPMSITSAFDQPPLGQAVAMPSASRPRPPGFVSQLMDSGTGRKIPPGESPVPGRSYVLTGFATHRRRKPVAVTSVNYHLHDTGRHISVSQLWTHPKEQRRGYASALMDDLYARHPQALIDHGGRTDAGQAWWDQYTDPDPDRTTTFGTPDSGAHTAGKDGTSDADFATSSMMIALVPPRTLADTLAEHVKDGEPADNMHVTLAYLPHVEPHDTGRIAGVVAEWASRHRPPVCRVQGAGTFVAPPGKPHVLWASVDIPDSSRLHSTLVSALQGAGFAPSQDHGFVPHLTLSYEKHHVRFLPKITPEPFTCHTVWVCRGGDWRPVPFGGATA